MINSEFFVHTGYGTYLEHPNTRNDVTYFNITHFYKLKKNTEDELHEKI